jgi:hypothetical protein
MVNKRVNLRAILADADLRRKLMVSTIQATQAREGIETSTAQASRAYYVVTEAERAAFFELKRFKGGKRGEQDKRHEMYVRSLRSETDGIRHDIARRDFGAIDGHPLAYQRVSTLAPIFRDHVALEPAFAKATKGLATTADSTFVREHFEIPANLNGWVPFAKGGDYCRFYSDVSLRVLWRDNGKAIYSFLDKKTDGSATRWINAVDYYFRPGLTWPRRTQRGFNTRLLPSGCIFSDKGPSVFPVKVEDTDYLLGVLNSALVEYILQGLTSFGSWEVGAVQRTPIPQASATVSGSIGARARSIYDAKATWDEGNEVSSRFVKPWLVSSEVAPTLSRMLDRLAEKEREGQLFIQSAYAALNDEVFLLYGVPAVSQAQIQDTSGIRPVEVLWPQMEGCTTEQKRIEHVWRLLSFAVKRVVEAEGDGIVPFAQSADGSRLVERVRQELLAFFPGRDESQLEVEIVNELKGGAKGYRKCVSLDDWLSNAFFEYHASLYKNRPIFWHIASAQGTRPFAFGALVHYHRFDKNRMAKLRATYVRDTIEELRRDAGLADKAGRTDDRVELQAKLEEVQALDRKLQHIQEGHHEGPEGGDRDFRILTPWKEPSAQPRGWTPDLDDGVKVNIAPLDRAGILRVAGVAG